MRISFYWRVIRVLSLRLTPEQFMTWWDRLGRQLLELAGNEHHQTE